ncbi:MAG: helix-turn-helix domain-containing protein, partial [Phycicoccus sp.]
WYTPNFSALDAADVSSCFLQLEEVNLHVGHPLSLIAMPSHYISKNYCALFHAQLSCSIRRVTERTEKITDLTTLRAIASPVRLRVYELLTSTGPTTATRLASQVDMAANAVSYHLRQLAKYGFAEETEGSGDQRERWWRAIPGGLRWRREDFASSAATEVLDIAEHLLLQRQMDRLTTWAEEGKRAWGDDWASAATSSDYLLWLTRSELDEMTAEVEELITRWVRASGDQRGAADDPDRVPIFSIFHAFPFDERSDPSSSGPLR